MGRIVCLMGKSASGKDTLYKALLGTGAFAPVLPYTTRPMRHGEAQGVEYHFVDEAEFARLEAGGLVVESREYQTIHGLWRYFLVDDGSLPPRERDALLIGTPESFASMAAYFGKEHMFPIWIDLEDGMRLQRAIDREKGQARPDYRELCRRYLADEEDFAPEKLQALGIERRFENRDLSACMAEVLENLGIGA